ncbi:type II toxin-antitoxin system Phd/YefM family antitoxin [Azospirillum sp. SYSU D00513]|uniref:type II toxin-antitoxin system Phd/YefM family antitoxin n=1 Tax=Azospirillum sp. SYSU D00513 TaxID=2812561 RepID=UPI001A97C1C7|nr:type II toxin-antitoxin system Phd/YefM family antitoxin [Azospirillum sp. SYSU D00513]
MSVDQIHGREHGRRPDWKLEDAEAQFSEVVRRARSDGPQRITLRGKEAVMIVSVEDWRRMTEPRADVPFVAFMQGLELDGLDLTREADKGRNVDL